jgi:hypothetical protein
VKALNPALERLEERIAPGLVCPTKPPVDCGDNGGSSASKSHSSKSHSSKSKSKGTKGTKGGSHHCKKDGN